MLVALVGLTVSAEQAKVAEAVTDAATAVVETAQVVKQETQAVSVKVSQAIDVKGKVIEALLEFLEVGKGGFPIKVPSRRQQISDSSHDLIPSWLPLPSWILSSSLKSWILVSNLKFKFKSKGICIDGSG